MSSIDYIMDDPEKILKLNLDELSNEDLVRCFSVLVDWHVFDTTSFRDEILARMNKGEK